MFIRINNIVINTDKIIHIELIDKTINGFYRLKILSEGNNEDCWNYNVNVDDDEVIAKYNELINNISNIIPTIEL